MKRIIFIATLISILLGNISLNAQETGNPKDVFTKDQKLYWFFIRVVTEKHPETRIESYNFRLSGRIADGTVDDFQTQLWRYSSRGTKFAIGPFPDYYEAKEAQLFYKNFSKDTIIIDKNIKKQKEAFYFFVDLYIRERSHSYGIKRIPAPIHPGNYANFAEMMQAGVYQKKVAIGPFRQVTVAEEAKRLYRLQ